MYIKCKASDEALVRKCLKIYLGDYTPQEQYAASILLHMMLKNKQFHQLMEELKEKTGFKVNNRQSSKTIAWAKKIKQRGACEVCGATEDLVAHHVVPWAYSIKGRTDPNNGQCLCGECHKMMHDNALWIEYMQEKVRKRE